MNPRGQHKPVIRVYYFFRRMYVYVYIYIYVYPLPYYPILFGASAHGLAGARCTFATIELLVGGTVG